MLDFRYCVTATPSGEELHRTQTKTRTLDPAFNETKEIVVAVFSLSVSCFRSLSLSFSLFCAPLFLSVSLHVHIYTHMDTHSQVSDDDLKQSSLLHFTLMVPE